MRTILDRLPYLPVFQQPAPGGTPPATPPAATPPATPPAATPPAGTPPATPPAGTPPATPPNAFTREPDDKGVTSPADFPADWREKWATGADGKVDPKVVDRLKRYENPAAFARAGLEAQTRIMSGKAGEDVPMPDPETDAEGAKKWREERGIPADATGYAVPDDVKSVLTEADAPLVANYTTFAHANGMSQAQVDQNLRWYAQFAEAQAEAIEASDKAAADAAEDKLREEWGADFKTSRTIAKKFADEAIPNVPWFMARIPNDPAYGDMAGKTLGNIPQIMQSFRELGLLKFGDVAFVGGEAAKATESRKAELKLMMDTKIDEWNARPDLRTEYFNILAAEEKRAGAKG
jgi:hypothetical protein